jgi:hypothetical protein
VFIFVDNPQLLFTLNRPPPDRYGGRQVFGLVMLDKYLYVVYEKYNKVEVFDFADRCQKIKDIEIVGMRSPLDMVGSSVTSQLFISENNSDVIIRVDSKTGVNDVVFVKTVSDDMTLSLVENRLLVTSRDSLLRLDIVSGKRPKKIPLPKDIMINIAFHAIESKRDSFFVCHGQFDNNNTVSEINSKGRVIRVFDNNQQLRCYHLALDSFGRLIVADLKNSQVVLLDQYLKYEIILIDNKRLDNVGPTRLNYNKNNNRLTVGLLSGHVKIFEY